MSKNGVRGLIVLALILAVFCTIAFVAPFCMTATFWAAFICGVVAIAFQFYVFSVSFSKGQGAKSKFYGFPIARIGVTYLLVQLVLSFVEMGLSCKIPAWVAIIINVIVFVIAAIGCIAAEVVRDEVVRQDEKVKQDIVNMKSLSAMAAGLPGLCQDEALKKDLQKLADEFKFSDPVSSASTAVMEANLGTQLQQLKSALASGDYESARAYCGSLMNGLSERNQACKLNK